MAFLGENAALPRPKRLAPCPWTLILVSLINKKGWTVCLIPKIPFLGIYLYSILYQGSISGVRYQKFTIFSYTRIYEDKSGYVCIPLLPTLSPSMQAGPENMIARSPCRENNDSLLIQIPRCDTHFG